MWRKFSLSSLILTDCCFSEKINLFQTFLKVKFRSLKRLSASLVLLQPIKNISSIHRPNLFYLMLRKIDDKFKRRGSSVREHSTANQKVPSLHFRCYILRFFLMFSSAYYSYLRMVKDFLGSQTFCFLCFPRYTFFFLFQAKYVGAFSVFMFHVTEIFTLYIDVKIMALDDFFIC